MKISKLYITILLLLTVSLLSSCNLPSRQRQTSEPITFPTQPLEPNQDQIPQTSDSCIIGNWVLENPDPAMLTEMLQKQSGQDVQINHVTGQMGVQFSPDGRATFISQGLAAEGDMPYQGTNVPVSLSTEGQSEVNYAFNEQQGELTLIQPDLSGFKVTAKAWVIPVYSGDLSSLLADDNVDPEGNITIQFSCTGDTLSFSKGSSGRSIDLQRVP